MHITSDNLRHTTREHHKPFRAFYVEPKGGVRKRIEKKMPLINHVPTLWVN